LTKTSEEATRSAEYWLTFWRRHRVLLPVVFLVIGSASAVLGIRDYVNRPWVATSQWFVSVKPVAGASQGSVTSFEAESRQVTIDLSQVLDGGSAASAIHQASHGSLTTSQVQAAVTASADNRVLTISAATGSSATSLAIDQYVDEQIVNNREHLIGPFVATRTDVTFVSPPDVTRQSAGHIVLMLGLRVLLAAIVAVSIALAWDYLLLPAAAHSN
jgi:hypothetical protein